MSRSSLRPFRSELRLCVALLIAAAALAIQATAYAQNGPTEYFDVNTTSGPGFGTPPASSNVTSGVWTTNSAGGDGSLTGWTQGDQMTFGASASDFAGDTFAVNLNNQLFMTGLLVNSTSANITLNGNGNFYLNGAQTWTVAKGSTLTEDNTWNGGAMNFNGAVVTLAGGGVINFQTAIEYNSGAPVTENDAGAGLTVNLDAANIGGATGGFLLTSGTLNFATAAAATGAFSNFGGSQFTINGGTIGNTSGAAQNLGVGSGGYAIGGSFTFTGSNSLNLGTSPVALTNSPTVTVAANTLTMGGVVSGTSGITKAGNGTLVFGNANTYTGSTAVNAGILSIQTSTGLGTYTNPGTITVASGATLQIQGASTVASEPISISGGGASGATGALENVYGANGFTGPVTLSGNTTLASDAGSLSLSNTAAISASGTTLTLAGAGNGSIAAGLSLGAGGITKNGAGIWTLSGSPNSFTGAATVNAGTLTITGATTGTSALSVAPGATFNYLPSATGALALGSGTISLANNSYIGLAFNGATSDQITSSGAASVPAGATVFLNISGTPTASTPYTLLTAGSGLTANSPTYVPINTNYTYSLSASSDGAVVLTTGTTIGSLGTEYWLGGFSGNANSWVASDGSANSNWASSAAGTATALLPGPTTSVVFSTTTPAQAPTATVLGANLTINSLAITSTGSPSTNAFNLNADGNTLTIAPSSSSNGIAVGAGITSTSTIAANIALGAAQTWTNSSATNASLTVSGNISNNGSYGLTIAGTGPTTISGALSGAGGLTMSGAGILTLSGANTYSGTTTLSAGTLYLNNNAALGNSGITNIFAVTGNATIDNTTGGTITIPQILNVANGVNLTFGGSNPLVFSNGMNGYNGGSTVTFTMNGTAPVTIGGIDNYSAMTNTPGMYNGSGMQNFDKAGPGTLILNGTGYYYGFKTLNLMVGTLDLNGNNILTAPNGNGTTLNITAGTTIDNTSGGLVSLSSNNGIATENWNGNFSFGGTNALTMAGGIALPSGGVTVTVNGSALVTQTGTVTGSGDTLTTAGSGSMTLSGNITTGTGGISVTGGTLTLAGANTYTGPTSVSGGTLQAGVASTAGTNGAFGLNSAVTLANVAGTTLSLSSGGTSYNTQIGSLSGGGSTGGNVSLGTAVLTDVQATSTTFSGVISSSSNTGGLTMNGTGGTLILAAAQTYTGPTTVSAGTLQINSTLASTAVAVSGGTLNLQDAGAVSQGTLTYSSGTLTEAVPNAISGSAGLAVSAGTLTLSQSNNYTGATTVSAAGVLNVPTAVSITNTSSLDVTGAGNLNISGTVTLGSGGSFGVGSGVSGTTGTVTVNTGATLNIGSGGGATFIGGALNNGQNGSGILTINGGTVNVAAPGLGSNGVGLNATELWLNPYGTSGTVSTLNLNGGTLSTARPIYDGSTNKSVVDFNGGTLQAAAAFTSGGLGTLMNVTTANVRNGGAIIDTNDFSVLLSQTLVHSTVGGDSAIDGGLTVLSSGGSSGLLTLGGTNTYTGPTNVMGGELLISGTESINSSSGITINGSGASLVQTSSVASTPTITLTQGSLQVGGTVGAVNVANLAANTISAGSGSSGTYTTGNLSFAGSATVNLLNGATLQVGTLATNGSGTPITLNVSGLSAGLNKLIGYSSYNGTNSSDFTVGTVTGLASNQSVVGGLVNNTAGNDIVLEVQGMAPGIITWATPKTISATTDILNAGTTTYAYATNNASTTVNGVNFVGGGGNSGQLTTGAVTNVSMPGFGSTYNGYGSPTGLSAAYGVITTNGVYTGGGALTVTLNNLTSGHVYATQIWINDSRGGYQSRTATATSTGGNTVTLSYANTNSSGSAGQYAIGGFAANATTQAFTLNGNQSTQLNAIQVRDVTGGWSGAVNNILDNGGTSSPNLNFTGSDNFATVQNILGPTTATLSFADTDGFGNAMTNSAISVAAAGVSTGTLNFENNAVAYSLTNASGTTGITGTTAVSVTGSGSVTFNSPNTYTGATTVSGGTLNVDSTLGNTTIGVSGGTLSLQTAGAVSQNTITVSSGALTETVTNAIGGSTALVLSGGTTTLSQANNYSGQTTLTTGTLVLGNNGALGNTGQLSIQGAGTVQASTSVVIPSTVPVNFNSGWTLSGTNSITFNGPLGNANTADTITNSITGNSATFAGNVYLSNSNTNADTLTFAGTGTTVVSGVITNNAGANTLASNLAKSGTAALTLSGANTYSGTTNLSAGQLNINNNGALGINTTTSNYFEVTGSATIDNTSGAAVTIQQIPNVAGVTLTFNGSNPLVFANGINGDGNNTTLTLMVNSGSPLTINGIFNTNGFIDTQSSNGGGMNNFVKAGNGTLILTGTSMYGGGKTITLSGGTLDVNSNGALQSFNGAGGDHIIISALTTIDNTSGVAVTIPNNSNNGPLFENWNSNFTFGGTNPLTMQTAITLGASTVTVTVNGSALETQTGAITLGADSLTMASTPGTGQLLLSGAIGGTGGVTVTGGTLTLSAANTYGNTTGGVTTINSGLLSTGTTGILALGGVASSIGQSSNVAANLVLGGGTLQYANTGAAETTDRLFTITGGTTTSALDASGTNSITFSNTGAIAFTGTNTPQTLTLTGTGAGVFAPTLGNNGAGVTSLTKTGAGSWNLTGANAYSGATTVNAGSLTVSGSGTLSGTTSLAVAAGATFNYLPTSTGPLTLGSGSTLNFASGSTIGLAFGDSIVASGVTTPPAGPVYLNLSGSFTSTATYPLLSAGSGSTLNAGLYYAVNPNYAFTLNSQPTSVTITPTTIGSGLSSAFWVGGLTGAANVWAVSSGSGSNWATSSGGAVQGLVPSSTTSVTISSSSVSAPPSPSVLGASMTINNLTINDTTYNSMNYGLTLNADGNTLTIAPSASNTGITMNSGVPASFIATPIVVGAAQSWTNNSNSPLTVSGNITSGLNLLTLAGSGSGGITITGNMTGTGGLQLTGNGTISAASSALTIQPGTITIGSAATLTLASPSATNSITSSSPITDGGTLAVSGAGVVNLSGAISGNGSVSVSGTGTTNFTASTSNTYLGTTTISGGATLVLGTGTTTYTYNGAATGISINGPSTLTIMGGRYNFSGDTITFGSTGGGTLNAISNGAGGFVFNGSPNTFTTTGGAQDTIAGSGLSNYGFNLNGSSATFNVASGTNGAVDLDVTGNIWNGGSITKTGSGVMALTYPDTYSGTTTISGGTLQLGYGGTTGSIAGTTSILDSANLAFDRTDTGLSIAVAISGTGAVQQIGSGTTTLTATNTYQGATTISAGTLALSNASGNNIASSGSIRIGGGAFLNVTGLTSGTLNLGTSTAQTLYGPSSGTGTVTGSVAVSSGSTIATGYTTSSSTLAFTSALTLNAGAISSFSLNGTSPNGMSNPLVSVGSALAVGGTSAVNLTFSNNPTGAGTYDLFGYGSLTAGSFANLSLTTAGLPGGFSYTLVNNTAGNQIDLSVVSSSLTWGGQTNSAWDTSTTNWFYGGVGTGTSFANSDIVSFGNSQYASGPTVTNSNLTISGSVSPASVTFNNTAGGVAYKITTSGAGISDSTAGPTTIALNGTGTVTLVGQNSYTGGTTLDAGLLNIANVNSIGSGSLTFNGGALQYASGLSNNASSSDISSSRSVAINGSGATIDLNGNKVTLASAIGNSGTGSLTVVDSSGSTTSTLTLQGSNTFSGGINLNGGIVNFSSLNNLGTGAISFGANSLPGGTLQWASSTDISTRTVTIGANGATFDINGNSVNLTNSIGNSGTGSLTLINSGAPATLTLSAANSYTGGTNINGGTLRINATSGSATGSGPVIVYSGGTLAAGIANPGAIGNVTLSSGGTISPSGGSNAAAGLGTVGTLAVGALALNTSGNGTFNYQVNGSAVADSIAIGGALTIPTSGATDTFNFYSVGTTGTYTFVTGDTYQLMTYNSITGGGANLNSNFSILNGTVPAGDVATFVTTTTSGPGVGALDLVISTAFGSATWSSSSNTDYATPSNWTQASGPYQEYPNGIGQVATFGTGSETTVSVNGAYTIGQLNFNNGGNTGSPVSYNLSSNGGSLTLNNSGNSGGASVNVSSGGLNSTLGSLLTLTLADPSLTTTFNIAGGSSLDVSGAINQTVSNEKIVLTGGGTLQLDSGASSYSGGTTVNGGTLILDPASGVASLGTGPLAINGSTSIVNVSPMNNALTVGSLSGSGGGQLNVASFATLSVNQSTSGTFAGTLSLGMNGGLVLQQASGNTLTISGASSLGPTSTIAVNSGTLALANNTGTAASIASGVTVSVAPGATLQLAGTSAVLSSTVNITTQGSGTSGDGALTVVGTTTQTVGVISGNTLGGSVTTYAGNTTVGDGTNVANLTATQILQNTLTINAGSTVTIAPSGPGIETDAQASEAVSGVALAAGSSDSSSESASDPFTAIQAAIASGSITSVKGEQLENRIAAIERLATTDPGLDVSLLEDRVLAALPTQSVWSSSGTAPLVEAGSGLLAVDSSTFASSSDASSGSAAAAFAPSADFGGSPAAVPEPSTLFLAALGGLGLALALRRRAKRAV